MDTTVYNIHVSTTDDDDDRRIVSSLAAVVLTRSLCLCLPFLAAYRLNISLKKHLQSCCKNLFPTYTANEREPHIKKSAVSELFFFFFISTSYIKLMKEFRLICAH